MITNEQLENIKKLAINLANDNSLSNIMKKILFDIGVGVILILPKKMDADKTNALLNTIDSEFN